MGMFDPDTGIFYRLDENGKWEALQLFWHGRIVRKEDCSKFEWDELLRKKRSLLGWLLY